MLAAAARRARARLGALRARLPAAPAAQAASRRARACAAAGGEGAGGGHVQGWREAAVRTAAVEPGKVYLVGTPIGNLGDITLRALQTLEAVDLVLAEDTRRAAQLLAAYGISRKELLSYHEHNAAARAPQVLARLAAGSSVALVSDAGMPTVSDPGAELVAAMCGDVGVAQAATSAPGSGGGGGDVVPVPGASAVLAALAASGFRHGRSAFEFAGFFPPKAAARRKALREVSARAHPVVAFAPPHKLAAILVDAKEAMGGDRRVLVARELTKLHEELWRGTLSQAAESFADGCRGEVTLVFDAASASPSEGAGHTDVVGGSAVGEIEAALRAALADGERVSAASRRIAKERGISRSRVYDMALAVQQEHEAEQGLQ